MKIMEISLAVAEEKQDKWYDEGHFKSMLTSLLEEGRYLQCRYEGNILILSEDTCLDRKSTRLNPSHTVISYAVFCLKKKKKRTRGVGVLG